MKFTPEHCRKAQEGVQRLIKIKKDSQIDLGEGWSIIMDYPPGVGWILKSHGPNTYHKDKETALAFYKNHKNDKRYTTTRENSK